MYQLSLKCWTCSAHLQIPQNDDDDPDDNDNDDNDNFNAAATYEYGSGGSGGSDKGDSICAWTSLGGALASRL